MHIICITVCLFFSFFFFCFCLTGNCFITFSTIFWILKGGVQPWYPPPLPFESPQFLSSTWKKNPTRKSILNKDKIFTFIFSYRYNLVRMLAYIHKIIRTWAGCLGYWTKKFLWLYHKLTMPVNLAFCPFTVLNIYYCVLK